MLVWRFCIMKAPFPDFLNPEDIFKRPTLRQANSEMTPVSYDSSYAIMKKLYESECVDATKVLHQGRGEGQRALADDLVPIEEIRRLCKYIHDDQAESYILNAPIQALLSSSNFNHSMPEAASAPHLIVPYPEELTNLLWPALVTNTAKVAAEFVKIGGVAKQAKHKRLYCARGCARAMQLIAQIFLRASAARPRDARGFIVVDSDPIYKLFPGNLVFKLPVFKHASFLAFAAAVRAAEDRELQGRMAHEHEEEQLPQQLTPITMRIDACMAPIHRQQQNLLAKMEAGFAMLEAAVPQAAEAAAGSAAAAAAAVVAELVGSEEAGKKKKKGGAGAGARYAAEEQARREAAGSDIPIVILGDFTTVREVWDEYKKGTPGVHPPLEELEQKYGSKWRQYGSGAGAKAFEKRRVVYSEVEYFMSEDGGGKSEEEAVAEVQLLLDAHKKEWVPGTRGQKPKAANWEGLRGEIRARRLQRNDGEAPSAYRSSGSRSSSSTAEEATAVEEAAAAEEEAAAEDEAEAAEEDLSSSGPSGGGPSGGGSNPNGPSGNPAGRGDGGGGGGGGGGCGGGCRRAFGRSGAAPPSDGHH